MTEREFLGLLEVDSASLLLVDPCLLPRLQAADTQGRTDAAYAVPVAQDLGLLVSCFGGDGTFPVFGEIEDGALVRLVVEFVDAES